MVLKGKIRGNGRQLAAYLLAKNQNEWVRVLEVNGEDGVTGKQLRNLLGDMSLNEQLTKSRQGIYHAVINPDPEASHRMQDEDWLKAADMLAAPLGFTGQRRAVVLHEKKGSGRIHAHVAYERYSQETGKMLPIAYNYRKQDKARAEMEQFFRQRPTPRRNPNRPEMRKTLTALWREAADGSAFIRLARESGYVIAAGSGRAPFMVVDPVGISFNLTRHLEGIKLKAVRERLDNKVLVGEQEAIAFIRNRQQLAGTAATPKKEQRLKATLEQTIDETLTHQPTAAISENGDTEQSAFEENLAAIKRRQAAQRHRPRPH